MSIHVVSFGTKEFYNSLDILKKSAESFGITPHIYTDEDIRKTAFYKKNKSILDQSRGAGYWIWKPYIILEVFNKIKPGDFVIYLDAGVKFISEPTTLTNLCRKNKGILLFGNKHINKYWTKRDCFILMNADAKKYWNANQVQASYQIYMKNKNAIKFLKEYLKFCEDARIVTDIPNTLEKSNFSGFKEHRHDQSIITNLAVKYNIALYRDPSQGGNIFKMEHLRVPGEWLSYPFQYQTPDTKSDYPTIFDHHRNVRKSVKTIHKIISLSPKSLRKIFSFLGRILPAKWKRRILRNEKFKD